MKKEQIVTSTPNPPLKQRAAVPSTSLKCFNCKHASSAFKISGKTHHQCCHPKHKDGLESGELSAWDTLQEWYNSCESHELRV